MSVPLILAMLLLTLTLAVMGVSVVAGEAARQRQLLVETGSAGASGYARLRQVLDRWSLRTSLGQRLTRMLLNASITTSVVDVVLGVVAATALLLFLANSLGGPVLVIGAAAGIFFGLRGYLAHRRRRRLDQFTDQLPELARLLANATQAGLSLNTALTVATTEMVDPLRAEVQTVVEEVSFGARLEDALSRMGDRLPSRELALLVNVLVIQIRSGGAVVSALRGVTESLETRRNLRREVKTLLAASKATMIAVVALGLLIVTISQSQIKGGLRGMLALPLGIIVAGTSTTLFIVGIALVNRISRVDV